MQELIGERMRLFQKDKLKSTGPKSAAGIYFRKAFVQDVRNESLRWMVIFHAAVPFWLPGVFWHLPVRHNGALLY